MEGRVFFKVLANCLTPHLLRNSYFDTAVQKRGVPGILGCTEHTGMVTEKQKRTKEI